jgi:hypothetical protein
MLTTIATSSLVPGSITQVALARLKKLAGKVISARYVVVSGGMSRVRSLQEEVRHMKLLG